MPRRPVRRGHLIVPFGTGGLMVDSRGISLLGAGLDHWFERSDGNNSPDKVDRTEFYVEEWRLQELLGVGHFMAPPDHRRWSRNTDGAKNLDLKVPYLRFPTWHYCPRCKVMKQATLVERGRVACGDCNRDMVQVPFVGICQSGHIQDVLWCEWVHKSDSPRCPGPLRLIATGGASLAGQKVRCECGAERSLYEIAVGDLTNLGRTALSRGDSVRAHTCLGMKPWLGSTDESTCSSPLFVTPRDATHVYFAVVESSLYVPRGSGDTPSELVERLALPPLAEAISMVADVMTPTQIAERIRTRYKALLEQYTPQQVEASLVKVLGAGSVQGQGAKNGHGPTNGSSHVGANKGNGTSNGSVNEKTTGSVVDVYGGIPGDTPGEAFRRAEFAVLRKPMSDPLLKVRESPLAGYDQDVARFFERIMLVDRIRETRALTGFGRLMNPGGRSLPDLQSMLWRTPPPPEESWLPAYTVFGEGLYFEFDTALLAEWEQHAGVSKRIAPLVARNERASLRRNIDPGPVNPRLVLLHTFAHLLMNRLAFECGYGSAALRERLYVSHNPNGQMAGVLVYTASGDSEGSMGGLVRMGKPGRLEPVIRRAIEGAVWCSADPVCMEAGERGGQGPDSVNLAACHACCHVPETSCEQFNKYLDRGVLVGVPGKPNTGFFKSLAPSLLAV
ncbi:MAG: DUF1998 domain-containing protein [Chloroflexota bacterium]|nr:DUF1998 domain-containing protein [Chloroflexota bacterium]